MVYNAGEAFPDSIVLDLETSAAVTKGLFVSVASGKVAPYTGAAVPGGAVGVALDAASASGKFIRVVVKGKATVTAAGAIPAGAFVSADTNSKAEAATANTDFVLGFEVEPAASSGVALVYLPGTPMNIDTTGA